MPEGPVPDLSVVVPVYHSAGTVEALARQVIDVTRGLGIRSEIVFVNDASADDSLARLMALARDLPTIGVVDLPVNVGQHAAVLHGLARARGRTCAIMDADLQDRPASLATLWRARSPDVRVVFGGRTGRYEGAGRHLTSRLFKWVLHRLTGIPSNAGMFLLLERDAVDAVLAFPTRTPWLQSMIGLLRLETISVPVERDIRRHGSSGYSGLGRLATAARGIWCVIEYRLWPPPVPYLTARSTKAPRTPVPPNRATNSS